MNPSIGYTKKPAELQLGFSNHLLDYTNFSLLCQEGNFEEETLSMLFVAENENLFHLHLWMISIPSGCKF